MHNTFKIKSCGWRTLMVILLLIERVNIEEMEGQMATFTHLGESFNSLTNRRVGFDAI